MPPTLPTVLATIVGFAIAIFCVYHALIQWRQGEGPRGIAVLFFGALFGLFVEYSNMRMMHSYYYGPFPFMIFGTVPLMIVLSWGAIIYGVMRTSDHMNLKWWTKPIYDGFLAISIDIGLDPVAIKLGYWVWNGAVDPPYWFGVPFGNYYGWYMVVFCFSMVARLGFRFVPPTWFGKYREVVIVALTMVVAILPFYLTLLLYGILIKGLHIFEPLVFAFILGLNLLIVLRVFAEVSHAKKFDVSAFAAPLFFNPFILFIYFAFGVEYESPALIILLPVTSVFSAICFAWPYLDDFSKNPKRKRLLSVVPIEPDDNRATP